MATQLPELHACCPLHSHIRPQSLVWLDILLVLHIWTYSVVCHLSCLFSPHPPANTHALRPHLSRLFSRRGWVPHAFPPALRPRLRHLRHVRLQFMNQPTHDAFSGDQPVVKDKHTDIALNPLLSRFYMSRSKTSHCEITANYTYSIHHF